MQRRPLLFPQVLILRRCNKIHSLFANAETLNQENHCYFGTTCDC